MLLRIFSLVCAILCLLPSASGSVLKGSLNVDNSFKVYISTDDSMRGVSLGSRSDEKWWITYDFSSSLTAGQDYYLHVGVTDFSGVGGFLGGFTVEGTDHLFSNNRDDVTTNPTIWRVSTTGWNNYQSATSYGANGVAPWGGIPTIPVRAKWIWSLDNENDNVVYFSTKIEAVEPLAHYKLEESSWNGISRDVIDATGNGYNGKVIDNATAFLPNTPISCRAMNIPTNNSGEVRSALNTGINVSTEIGNTGTISFWYRPTVDLVAGTPARALFDATGNTIPREHFYLVIQDGSLKFRVKNGNDESIFYSSPINPVAGEWLFISVTWDLERGRYQIFAKSEDGVTFLFETRTDDSPSSIANNSRTLFIGDNRNLDTNRVPGIVYNSAYGDFDDIRVYKHALTKSMAEALYLERDNCDPEINHYQVIHEGNGLTCEAETVTIRACTNAYDGTCTLSNEPVTLDVKATGSGLVTESISFTGTGRASIPYTVAESTVLSIENPSISATNATVCFDGSTTNCNLTFSDAGFRFLYGTGNDARLPNQTSGTEFGDVLKIQAVKNSNGVCTGLFNGNKDVDLSQ